MIGALVVGVLTVLALAYVLAPFRRPETEPLIEGPTPLEEASERKTAALAAIVDVEEEAAVGKLTPAHLSELRVGYEREAVVALEELDRLQAAVPPEDPFETEVAEMKKRLACPSCGAPRDAGERCDRCGV